jgi:hypothetical protein
VERPVAAALLLTRGGLRDHVIFASYLMLYLHVWRIFGDHGARQSFMVLTGVAMGISVLHA